MKKVVLIVLPLFLIGGTVVGLGMLGIINLPFLPLAKKKVKTPPDDGKGGPFAPLLARLNRVASQAAAAEKTAKKAVPPPAAIEKPETGPGEAKLAKLWAEVPADKLIALTSRWPEPSLGRILAKMDGDAVSEYLAALPSPRAAKLSQAIASATDEATQKVHADLKN